jgi:acetyl-CoA C-acetyltransferase
MGNVVSAGMGQAPTRQAVMFAGLPEQTVCTTINKVCASGMKSIMFACQTLACSRSSSSTTGKGQTMLAGGFESMSNIPHYLPTSRTGSALGNTTLIDGMIHDGLWDPYDGQHMGMCGEKCAKDYGITRDDQDFYAIESYRRAQAAWKEGVFEEVVPVQIPSKKSKNGGDSIMVRQDEEPTLVQLDKISTLKPAFDRHNGTITAANASSLNDGACAMILMKEQDALDHGIQPLARIRGFGDAEQLPVDFSTSPSLAVPVAVKNAGCTLNDIEYHEINEAFSVVVLANMQLMNLDPAKVNVFGGAVSLGHPIGMSGARIIGTLYDVLKHKDASIGCASICNGGGGASAMVIERMN